LQDSDDSEDIDMVNTAPRMGESESDDDSDDDDSDEDSDEKEDVAGPPKAQKRKDGTYAYVDLRLLQAYQLIFFSVVHTYHRRE
jgi:hypothetical protein